MHSKNLQQVLDIVVSHQALPLKCQLLLKLLLALVAPAPEHHRALLRRLAGLTGDASVLHDSQTSWIISFLVTPLTGIKLACTVDLAIVVM